MPSSTRRSVSPSMPSACEVTVRATHGSADWSGSNVPPPLASCTPSTPLTRTSAATGRPTRRTRSVMGRPPAGRDHGEQGEERETGADEERVAEGPRGGALQLLVEVALELGRGGTLLGVEVHRREGAVQVGDLTLLLRQLAAERLAIAILSSGFSGASSTRDVMASWAGTSASCRSAVNTGVRIASPTTTPTWRAPMVHPACRTRGSRISIAWEVSRSTVSPSPRPTSAWGATVQTRSADGRIARPTSPPAMRKQPTATSTSGGGRRSRASGRAASAATGTTDTVSAAVAGEWPQPSTRSRTSRNNAAVSAADSRARVRLGRTAGRCRSGVRSPVRRARRARPARPAPRTAPAPRRWPATRTPA